MKPRQQVGGRQMLQFPIELLNYALQSICPLIARNSKPGHGVLHATFAVVKCFPISGHSLFLGEDAGVQKV